jgi:hypothetical protein
MADYETLTVSVHASHDANHDFATIDQEYEFTASPEYHRLADITLAAAQSATVTDISFGAASPSIDSLFIYNRKSSTSAVRAQFSDVLSTSTAFYIDPGCMAAIGGGVTSDVTLTNTSASDDTTSEAGSCSLVIYAAGA